MFELTIHDQVYQFRFGMGFLKEINGLVSVPVDGLQEVKRNIGLRYIVARIIDGDLEALVDALYVANKGQSPRLSRALLEAYIEDESTDIDKLFEDVLDFLKTANCTSKTVKALLAAMEEAEENNS